jgi:hypothetical protein
LPQRGKSQSDAGKKGTASLLAPLANVLTSATGSWTAVFIVAVVLDAYDRIAGGRGWTPINMKGWPVE